MGEANGPCTESYECLIKNSNRSIGFSGYTGHHFILHIAITRDLTRETWSFCFEVGGIFIIYRGDFRIHYFRKQNIISLHGEIVKSVFCKIYASYRVIGVSIKNSVFPRSDTVVGRGHSGISNNNVPNSANVLTQIIIYFHRKCVRVCLLCQ